MSKRVAFVAQGLLTGVLFALGALLYLLSPVVLPESAAWYLFIALVWLAGLALYNLQTPPAVAATPEKTSRLYQDTLENYLDLIFWSVDTNMRVVDVGGSALASMVQSKEALLGRDVRELPILDGQAIADVQRALQGESFVVEHRLGDRHYRTHFFPEFTILGEVSGCLCATVDLTEVHRLDTDLALAREVIENASDAIVIADARRRAITINQSFTAITGYSIDQVLGQKLIIPNISGLDFAGRRQLLKQLRSHGLWQGEVTARRYNGEPYVARVTVSQIRDRGVLTHYLTCFADISEIKQRHDELRHLAHHDFLTGLPNRRLFLDRLEQVIKRTRRHGGRFALYFIDLDKFKAVNDNLGHHVGDELLREVASRITDAMRDMDTVARLAGDEFTVIVEQVADDEEVRSVADKILSCFETPSECLGKSLDCRASLGYAVYPDDGDSLEVLMAVADTAMYRAKAGGVSGELFPNQRRRFNLSSRAFEATELRLAIATDELELHYQPQIEVQTGRISGCEALVRWNRQRDGQLLPGDFLALAEAKGLMDEIGHWVARAAGQQFSRWQQQGIHLDRLALNVSQSQLRDERFFVTLEEVVASNSLRPENLQLEVSLATALADSPATQAFFARARALGVGCILEDFGCAEEGFQLLGRLRVDAVKIDPQLLQRGKGSREARAVVAAVVALGEALDFRVVAVGVEQQRQLESLGQSGCHMVQGFYYARSLAAEDFARFYLGFNQRTGS